MTERKLFKNKLVYWLVISLNIFIFLPLISVFIEELINGNFLSSIISLPFAGICFVAFSLLGSLVLLILKNKKSIIILSSVLILILMVLTIFFFQSIFIKKDFENDITEYVTATLPYLIGFGFLFMMQKFKYIEDFSQNEIEEIGRY